MGCIFSRKQALSFKKKRKVSEVHMWLERIYKTSAFFATTRANGVVRFLTVFSTASLCDVMRAWHMPSKFKFCARPGTRVVSRETIVT